MVDRRLDVADREPELVGAPSQARKEVSAIFNSIPQKRASSACVERLSVEGARNAGGVVPQTPGTDVTSWATMWIQLVVPDALKLSGPDLARGTARRGS